MDIHFYFILEENLKESYEEKYIDEFKLFYKKDIIGIYR